MNQKNAIGTTKVIFGRWSGHVVTFSIIILLTAPHSFTGKVVSIHDGDTITVLHDSTQVKVRLNEIDAPELKQAFGQRARQALGERLQGKTVRVEWEKLDKYGRTLGTVYIHGRPHSAKQATESANQRENTGNHHVDESINLWLVRNGWAWQYWQYSKSETLKRAEDAARKERVGLWQDASPVPPWEWRKKKSPTPAPRTPLQTN